MVSLLFILGALVGFMFILLFIFSWTNDSGLAGAGSLMCLIASFALIATAGLNLTDHTRHTNENKWITACVAEGGQHVSADDGTAICIDTLNGKTVYRVYQ